VDASCGAVVGGSGAADALAAEVVVDEIEEMAMMFT
jgi:hypothetical protein